MAGRWVTVALWAVLARWGARRKSIGRNRIARSGQDSVGRVEADGKAGAYYASDSKGRGRSNELLGGIQNLSVGFNP